MGASMHETELSQDFSFLLQLPKVASSDALSKIITRMAGCFGLACLFFE